MNNTCEVCGTLPDSTYASQKFGSDENTYLPDAFNKLLDSQNNPPLQFNDPNAGIYHCPLCNSQFQLITEHEYLVCGSEDSQELNRIK